MRRLLASLSVLIAAATMIVLGTSPAHAAVCPTYYKTYSANGSKIAEICRSTEGQITFQSRGQYRGVQKYMYLRVCRLNPGNTVSNCDVDDGQFYEYAGPIADPGGCLRMWVKMYNGNGGLLIDDRVDICN